MAVPKIIISFEDPYTSWCIEPAVLVRTSAVKPVIHA